MFVSFPNNTTQKSKNCIEIERDGQSYSLPQSLIYFLMQCIAVKSRVIKPKEDTKKIILQMLKKNRVRLKNGDILVVASKIISLSQNRIVQIIKKFRDSPPAVTKASKLQYVNLQSLVKKEADKVIGRVSKDLFLTVKDGVLIPNAGIDISNVPHGFAVCWPQKPFAVARELWTSFKKTFRLKKFGVIISDSHCQPLRWGTTGLAIGFAGFEGVSDVRGEKDIFGKKLKVTKIAVADNLASAALLLMREAAEKIPFAICRKANVTFSSKTFSKKDVIIHPRDCLFLPLYRNLKF